MGHYRSSITLRREKSELISRLKIGQGFERLFSHPLAEIKVFRKSPVL
jgi:hypothetical protein